MLFLAVALALLCVKIGAEYHPGTAIVSYTEDYEAFVDHTISAIKHHARKIANDLYAIRVTIPHVIHEGLWLEFGVYKGTTMKILVEERQGKGKVYGFDSFMGLPENWRDQNESWYAKKGAFNTDGQPPFPANDNVEWIIGLYDKTIDQFLDTHTGEEVALLHMDADLYSSTKTVFDACLKRGLIKDGLVIIFDELINYPEYRQHEMKNLWELLRDAHLVAEIIGIGDFSSWGPQYNNPPTLNPDHELMPQQVSIILRNSNAGDIPA